MTVSAPLSILPPLTDEEARHSTRVEALIRQRIAEARGWLDFEAFMDLALYAPGLGYYSAGSAKLGPAGDFVTAPELSDLFSRCVARQCAEILHALGGGQILALGPGTGRMAAVILGTLAQLDALPERYAILEVSADLRARQQDRIAQLPASVRERVVWLDRWPETPLSGVILANEVLDALPCRRFVVRSDGARGATLTAHQLGVGVGPDGRLVELERPVDAPLESALAGPMCGLPEPLPDGYRSELCLWVAPWIQGLSDVLARGVALLFDYGLPRAHYYHPDRTNGTLRCHFKQRAHDDPLTRVGVQDITAWVDFTRVAEAADAARLDVLGFVTQAAFLLGTGIESLIVGSGGAESTTGGSAAVARHARLAGEARKLLLPGEMGEAFKAIALARRYEDALQGFALQDLRASL
ncbi:MAG: class I SAM-dependent methyltransferase [Steroidobacteraceae bacterium]